MKGLTFHGFDPDDVTLRTGKAYPCDRGGMRGDAVMGRLGRYDVLIARSADRQRLTYIVLKFGGSIWRREFYRQTPSVRAGMVAVAARDAVAVEFVSRGEHG